MEDNDRKRLEEKIRFFFNERCKVHVLKFDKTFWRGYIKGEKSDGVWNFYEDKLGDVLLFVSDIHDINLFRVVEE